MECKKIIDYDIFSPLKSSVDILPIVMESNPIDNSIFASTLLVKPVCVNGCCKCRNLYCCCDMSCKIDDGTSTAIAYCNGKLCFTLLEIYKNDIIQFIKDLLLEGKTYEYPYDILLFIYLISIRNPHLNSDVDRRDDTIFGDCIKRINGTAPVYNMKVRCIKKSNNSTDFVKTISYIFQLFIVLYYII